MSDTGQGKTGSAFTAPPGCACGCGSEVTPGRLFAWGHNTRTRPKTRTHLRKLARARDWLGEVFVELQDPASRAALLDAKASIDRAEELVAKPEPDSGEGSKQKVPDAR